MADLLFSGGDEDLPPEPELEPWVRIQQATFTNWINDKLRAEADEVDNIRTDFKSGVKLCKLMTILRGKKLHGKIIEKKKLREYEARGNIALALEAMQRDDIKLVNIGPEDIFEGNTKIILGMIWLLIRRYQIGSQTKLPPKKMMLEWVNAILHPYMEVSNFSSDWNDGIALSFQNCEAAMLAAEEYFGISLVVSPENFSSPHLDDLSGMTYLSYFMEPGSCGYQTTLNWLILTLGSLPSPVKVDNFDTDWNNGYVAGGLATALGANVPGWPNISGDWLSNCQSAMTVSEEQLGVRHVLNAKDMTNPEVDHIALMAYTAWHTHAQTREATPPPPAQPQRASVLIEPPPEPVVSKPREISVSILDRWRVGAATTFTVDTSSEGPGEVLAIGRSPSGEEHDLARTQTDTCVNDITFYPDEHGLWQISIMYRGSHIAGSPFDVYVYDASLAKIVGNASSAETFSAYRFEVDCSRVGIGDVDVHVLYAGERVSCDVAANDDETHQVTFTPDRPGVYQVQVFCGGVELPGSPFDVNVIEGTPPIEPTMSPPTSFTLPASLLPVVTPGMVLATGPGLQSAMMGKESLIDVDTSAAPNRALLVSITAPSGNEVAYFIRNQNEEVKQIVYKPNEIGNHSVKLAYDDVDLQGSPWNIPVGQGQIYIRNLQNVAYAGQESDFEIDCSEMPKGTIEIDSDLPIHRYTRIQHQTYAVTFLPKRVGKHDMIIKYNDQPVGEPYIVDVITPGW